MALSGIFYGPWLGSGYQRIRLDWSATQDVASNTSTITCVLKWDNSAGVALSSTVAKNVSIVIAGQTFTGTATVGIAANTIKTLLTASKTVSHATDGTLSTIIRSTFDLKFTLGGTYYESTTTGDDTISLDTIPRASQPTLSSGTVDMGSAVTINMNRASSAFTHTVEAYFGSAYTLIGTGITDSVSFTPPMEYCNQIPNSTSGSGVIYVHTYNGGTQIGTKTVGFTGTVPASIIPNISAISKTGVSLLSGNYVQNKSKVTVGITAAGSYGSTISTYYTEIKYGAVVAQTNGNSSWTTSEITASGTVTIVCYVTDSRGRQHSASTTVTVQAYAVPYVTAITAFRCNSSGVAQDNGTYIRAGLDAGVSSVNSANAKSFKIQYKRADSGAWIDAMTYTAGYTYNSAVTIGGGTIDVNYSYHVRGLVTDSYTTTTKDTTVGTAFTLMDFHSGGKGIAIGKVAESDNLFDIALPTKFAGAPTTPMGSLLTSHYTSITFAPGVYAKLAYVSKPGLSSGCTVVLHGTSGNTVIDCKADIIAQHSGDIVVTSMSGMYTQVYLKISSDSNCSFTIEVSGNIASTIWMDAWIYPHSNETIVRNPTSVASSATVHIHTTTAGGIGVSSSESSNIGINGVNVALSNHNHSGVYVPTQTISFTPLTLQGGWVQYVGWGDPAGYYKDQFGFVHLRGCIKSGSVPSYCAFLPAGYRPSYQGSHMVLKDGGWGQLNIYPNGGIEIAVGSSVATYLNTVSFYAGN